jgi:hypothetical protein
MKKSIVRGMATATFAGIAIVGSTAPALAAEATPQDNGGVAIVDQPDTSRLNNVWTFAPLGVPVLGLFDSLNAAPGKLLPSV